MTSNEVKPLDLRVLLDPSSVAVIGASANPAGHAGRSLTNLVRTGFTGRVLPINPRYDELQGLPCYPDIASVPQTPELVYILRPAKEAVDAVRDAGRAGVQLAIVCSSGFSELGESGGSLQAELAAIRDEFGIRVIGPNCIGVVSPSTGFIGAPTFNITADAIPGGLSILSHSGGLAATAYNRAQACGLGVHSLVSLGNEADITMAEVMEVMAADEAVTTIALVVEEIREPARFVAAARACFRAGKSLVALKTGRSAAGAAAVSGHTGALAGDAAVFSAVLRENGIREARSIDQLVDGASLLVRNANGPLGRRLAVISPSGGEAVYVADQSRGAGLDLPPLPEELAMRLQELMPLGSPGNPLDLTGQIIGNAQILTDVLATMSGADVVDTILVCLASWGEYDANALLPTVLAAAREVQKPIIFSSWEAGAMTERAGELLTRSGLPWFPSPDRALAAIDLIATEPALHEVSAVSTAAAPAPPAGVSTLGERSALELLGAMGVPVVAVQQVPDAQSAAAAAAMWNYEVVLKADAPDLLHKTEHNLVDLRVVATPEGVTAAAERLRERAAEAGIGIDGLLVARREAGVEMIVGGLVDPQFGRFVLVGAGGVLAEHTGDTALVSAPCDADAVRKALGSLRIWPVLRGVRGGSNDVAALVDLVVRFSRVFAASPWMDEVDLNPVMVRSTESSGAVAVDAVVVVAEVGG